MSVATFTVHLASADCASEAQSLERVLHGAPGVRSVYVNPVTSRATVTADPDVLDAAKLTDLMRDAGAEVLAIERSPTTRVDPTTAPETVSESESERELPVCCRAHPVRMPAAPTADGSRHEVVV